MASTGTERIISTEINEGQSGSGTDAVQPDERPPFQPPSWARDYDKHHPLYGEDWNAVVRRTGLSEGEAVYHPDLSLADIERMELETVRPEHEISHKSRNHKRVYWRDMGRVIGASCGEQTTFVYVEYGNSGNVHGRPVTLSQLRRWGVRP